MTDRLDECGAVTPEPVKIDPCGPEVRALCTLQAGHAYDHYDEALNWQWENTP